jgi:hypothetical protein
MNKIKYSNVTRIIAFFLLEILVISASVSTVFLGTANIGLANFQEEIKGKSYIESKYFKDQLMANIGNANYYMEVKNDFELDGVYDASKQVPIKQFLNNESDVSEYSSAQLYLLQDLIDWSQAGVEETTVYQAIMNLQSRTVTNHKIEYADRYVDIQQFEASAEDMSEIQIAEDYTVLIPKEFFDILQQLGINYSEEIRDTYIIKERYTSAEDVTFMEVARYDWDLEKIIRISEEIKQALSNINEEYNFYKSNETYFTSIDSTNFKIYIQDDKGNVILNNCVDANTTYEEYFMNNVSGGIIYNAANKEFTFTDNINDDAYANVDNFKIKELENYVYAVGVDKNLAHEDVFSQGNRAYNNARVSIFTLLGSLLGILILFVYLVAVSGRSVKDEEIHLNTFDKIKTEIGAGIMIALGIGGILITEMTMSISGTYYGLVVGMAVEATLFTLGFLSLVKRIKAGQLWKNSLCYFIIKFFVCFLYIEK